MKLLSTKIISLLSATVLSFSAMAQQRQVELEVSISSPSANAVIPYDGIVDFKIIIKNNGPEDLITNDSIFFETNLQQGVQMATVPGAVPSGQGVELPLQFRNQNTTGTDQVANLCIRVFDPSTQLTDTNNNPVMVGYIDTDTTNNDVCVNNITFKTAPTSVKSINVSDKTIAVFPNPANDKVSFKFTALAADEVIVSLVDILGREVLSKNFGNGQLGIEKFYELDITQFKSGSYILMVTNGDNKSTSRIVIK